MEKRPRLEFSGQSSEEVLAHIDTHSLFSVLNGLKWCIQAKTRVQGGEDKLSNEERVFLAVSDLISEVNNGGYHQFFWNSSRRFAPIIVDSLRRIDCERTAGLTEKAIAALGLRELTAEAVTEEIQRDNPERDARLEALSKEFYSFHEATDQLVHFVIAERTKIQAPRTEDYPRFPKRRERSNASKLESALAFWRKGWNPNFEEVLDAAKTIAREKSIPATDKDLRGAAVLYYLARISRSGKLDGSEALVREAFALMRDEPSHIVVHKNWIEAMLVQGKTATADEYSVAYLEFLKAGGRGDDSVQKSIIFWTRLVQAHRGELPKSVTFFIQNFPQVNLENLPTGLLISPSDELYKRNKPPAVVP